MFNSFINLDNSIDFLGILDNINSNTDIKQLPFTEEQLAGANRPLPDPNSHISFILLKERIKTLEECKWYNFKSKKELLILKKIFAQKESLKDIID